MKEYINYFYFIVDKTKNWENSSFEDKIEIVKKILNIKNNSKDIVNYIDKYIIFLANNSLNSFSKSVLDVQI